MSRGSPMRHLSRRLSADEGGQRLDQVLAAWLPAALGIPLSRSSLRRLVMAGAVRVGGRPLRRPGTTLRAGDRLDALVDVARLKPPATERVVASQFGPERILHRDMFVLVVDKPAGLAMHATADASRPNLYDLVKSLLRTEGREPYLGLHQRLDRDTSGVALFTLDPAANAPLAAAFASGHGIAKTYHALCARPPALPPRSWRVQGALGGSGPYADTAFRLLRSLPRALLVEARPSTGRKHQIRIHLAEQGLPILGDARYGSKQQGRVMLHAVRLEITHPVTGAPLRVESAYPADFRDRLVTPPGRHARS